MSEQRVKHVVLAVGNNMMGDDGAGPLLYDMMTQNPIADWYAIDGGSAPENSVHQVRELKPELLVLVDAADMELDPGQIRIIDADSIAEMFIMSTHNLPLNFLIDQLKEDIPQVIFMCIKKWHRKTIWMRLFTWGIISMNMGKVSMQLKMLKR